MGAIIFPIRSYLDSIIDVVSIKTGLILSYEEIIAMLKEDDENFDLALDNIDGVIRIRSETFEDQIKVIRIKLGNLSEELRNPFLFATKLKKWLDQGVDPGPAFKAVSQVIPRFSNQVVNPLELFDEIKKITDSPDELIVDLIMSIAQHQQQSSDISYPERKEWKGGVPLQDIFHCELKSCASEFLEQNFLDYLAVNADQLDKIHWRNFERFCAEFFQRQGYVTELGSGTNDGGIDIRAFDPNDTSKPLIIIQCKRYGESHPVSIETVKSFYTDVAFEGAKKGMIVTTSYIAKGGKKVSAARGYPLSFAENDEVRKWAASMWRYASSNKNI